MSYIAYFIIRYNIDTKKYKYGIYSEAALTRVENNIDTVIDCCESDIDYHDASTKMLHKIIQQCDFRYVI